jgi:hypothetical protein
MIKQFYVGQEPVLTFTCKSRIGVVGDPGTFTVEVRHPDRTKVTYVYGIDSEITRISPGIFEFAHPVVVVGGTYKVTGTTTGNNAAGKQSQFFVEADNTP